MREPLISINNQGPLGVCCYSCHSFEDLVEVHIGNILVYTICRECMAKLNTLVNGRRDDAVLEQARRAEESYKALYESLLEMTEDGVFNWKGQPVEPIKVLFKYHRAFEYGMNQGAQAAALDTEEPVRLVGIKYGYRKERELGAFSAGYDLGRKYVSEWRKSKNLLRVAIECGDVIPRDFQLAICNNSTNYCWEELNELGQKG